MQLINIRVKSYLLGNPSDPYERQEDYNSWSSEKDRYERFCN